MLETNIIEQFLYDESVSINLLEYLLHVLLTIICSHILSKVYTNHGQAISNRAVFAGNFIIISVTTLTIITIVKSSLALSLGLVGALSIVRFRSAIKEPEELAYLFLTIAIGLGFGAGHKLTTLISFIAILIVIYTKSSRKKNKRNYNTHLIISDNKNLQLEIILDTVKTLKDDYVVKRYEKNKDLFELILLLPSLNEKQLISIRNSLQEMSDSVNISFIHSNS